MLKYVQQKWRKGTKLETDGEKKAKFQHIYKRQKVTLWYQICLTSSDKKIISPVKNQKYPK